MCNDNNLVERTYDTRCLIQFCSVFIIIIFNLRRVYIQVTMILGLLHVDLHVSPKIYKFSIIILEITLYLSPLLLADMCLVRAQGGPSVRVYEMLQQSFIPE